MYIAVPNGTRLAVCHHIETDVGRSKPGVFTIPKMSGLYITACVSTGALTSLGLESFINEIHLALKYRN